MVEGGGAEELEEMADGYGSAGELTREVAVESWPTSSETIRFGRLQSQVTQQERANLVYA